MLDKKELLLSLNNIKDNTENLFNALTNNIEQWKLCEDTMHCPVVFRARLAIKHVECFTIPKVIQTISYINDRDVYNISYLIKSLILIAEWNRYVCNLIKNDTISCCESDKCYILKNSFPMTYTFADQQLCYIYAIGLDVILNGEINSLLNTLEKNNEQ